MEKKGEYKKDMERYHKEQAERNAQDDIKDQSKKEEADRKMREIKAWRLEHAKLKAQKEKNEIKDRIQSEQETIKKLKEEQEMERSENDKRKMSQL